MTKSKHRRPPTLHEHLTWHLEDMSRAAVASSLALSKGMELYRTVPRYNPEYGNGYDDFLLFKFGKSLSDPDTIVKTGDLSEIVEHLKLLPEYTDQ
jgi:hypothetical protein